jgi:hypothetical protein
MRNAPPGSRSQEKVTARGARGVTQNPDERCVRREMRMAMKKATKKASAKKAPAKSKAARPAARSTTAAKYEQAGAPWWKRVPPPPPKQ